jgi:hypothetical protein
MENKIEIRNGRLRIEYNDENGQRHIQLVTASELAKIINKLMTDTEVKAIPK